jgi:hypothetical protein
MARQHGNDWAIASLRAAIDASGLGTKMFANSVLVRPASTVYRWLNGSRPIPKCVKDHLLGNFRILAPPVAPTTHRGKNNG